jgi:hypothetical protein
MKKRELKRLAKLLFQLTRKKTWLGGKTCYSIDGPEDRKYVPHWPKEMELIHWGGLVVWTLSPEVDLGGHKLRVCVADRKSADFLGDHVVRVFVDNQLMYPGGAYETWSWPWLWSTHLAKQEVAEGGKTSPVDTRKDLIAEAEERVHGVKVIKQLPAPEDVQRAEREIAELMESRRPARLRGKATITEKT